MFVVGRGTRTNNYSFVPTGWVIKRCESNSIYLLATRFIGRDYYLVKSSLVPQSEGIVAYSVAYWCLTPPKRSTHQRC